MLGAGTSSRIEALRVLQQPRVFAGGEPRIDDAVLIRPNFEVIEIKRREDSNAGVLIGVSSRAVCRVSNRSPVARA